MKLPASTPAAWRGAVSSAALAGALTVAGLAGTAKAAEKAGACDRTTTALATSCLREAPGDYYQAIAVCTNLGTAGEKKRCIARAGRVLRSDKQECREQRAARQRVCQTLGQAPYDPVIRPGDFTADITNPYFPLKPGTVYVYKAPDSTVTVTVTRRKVKIMGVECIVVRDTNVVDGEVEEDTEDYYAQDKQGNVWYFGEDTAEFVHGVAVSFEGSFIAGIDGAKPGIIMPANPKPGSTSRQEAAFGDAEDLARIERLGENVRLPFGTFGNALKTFEFTPLEPDARENKYYAPGVGLVLTVNLENGEREQLVSIKRPR